MDIQCFSVVRFFIGIAYNVNRNRLSFIAGGRSVEFSASQQILMGNPFCKIMYAYHEIGWGLRARPAGMQVLGFAKWSFRGYEAGAASGNNGA